MSNRSISPPAIELDKIEMGLEGFTWQIGTANQFLMLYCLEHDCIHTVDSSDTMMYLPMILRHEWCQRPSGKRVPIAH